MRRDRSVLVSPCTRTDRHTATCGGTGGCSVGVAVEVDVCPAQRPGFLGADPGQQAQRDVGVHQLGRAADVLQAGPQLDYGQGPGCGDDRDGLLEGEGP